MRCRRVAAQLCVLLLTYGRVLRCQGLGQPPAAAVARRGPTTRTDRSPLHLVFRRAQRAEAPARRFKSIDARCRASVRTRLFVASSQVVGQLIDSAERRITMVSYAAYQSPAVIAALDAGVARGVFAERVPGNEVDRGPQRIPAVELTTVALQSADHDSWSDADLLGKESNVWF